MTTSKMPENEPEDMPPEYRFDYRQARPNRFAGRVSHERLVVTLDADVSQVFTTLEAVNTALRVLVAALPKEVREGGRAE